MATPKTCPEDPEAERPKNFVEAISGDGTWETFGIRIKWTDPVVPGNLRLPVNQPVKLRLCVETNRGFDIAPENLSAWCWTHIRFADNPCGIWREIKLDFNPRCTFTDPQGFTSHVFQSSIIPTADDQYRLTFNVKYNKLMIWANYFQVDNLVDVHEKPSVGTQYDPEKLPPEFKDAFACRLVQFIQDYAQYFVSLFCDHCEQQSTSQGSKEKKKKKKPDDCDEVEMLVKL